MMTKILVIAIGYLFGLFQTGYLLSNYVFHEDIRKKGSGNSGATNTLRIFGVRAGFLVFLGDAGKSILYCAILKFGLASVFGEASDLMALYGAIGVILGHCYPFYMGFKGGKGVASTAGLLLIYDFRIAMLCLLVFVLIVAMTRYVSLGSLCVLTTFALSVFFFHTAGWHELGTTYPEAIVLVLLLTGYSFYAHRSNIGRLMSGTENRIF